MNEFGRDAFLRAKCCKITKKFEFYDKENTGSNE